MTTSTQTLGERLTYLRKKQGYSMKTLADLTGISAAYICKMESGQRKPARDVMLRLVNSLLIESSQQERDELLLLAGFAPLHYRSFMGKADLIKLYQEALEAEPDNFKFFISLVMVLIRSGRFADAEVRIQKGIQTFDDQVQLQALLAALELAKGQFDTAIEYQRSALDYFKMAKRAESQTLALPDLLLSLGVIYFLKGESQLDQLNHGQIPSNQTVSGLSESAWETLSEAKKCFHQALKASPEDVYILDEYARVCYSLATLDNECSPSPLWKESASNFKKVICSPDKHNLGATHLLHSTSFWALALAKSQDYESAWLQLSVVEACIPDFWLVHYLKASYFCLRFQEDKLSPKEKKLQLDLALKALEIVLKNEDPQNPSRTEALVDPDLNVLRQEKKLEFMNLMKKYGS
ncbi:MAG: helix-turn-helix transcriptional regulator [Candidatus Sericytochromatia bacterium]|nr:helix-turn-helix transcriptional regulator [Candidatus Sericytochromatia bacterium]